MEVGPKQMRAWMANETWCATTLHHLERELSALVQPSKIVVRNLKDYERFCFCVQSSDWQDQSYIYIRLNGIHRNFDIRNHHYLIVYYNSNNHNNWYKIHCNFFDGGGLYQVV